MIQSFASIKNGSIQKIGAYNKNSHLVRIPRPKESVTLKLLRFILKNLLLNMSQSPSNIPKIQKMWEMIASFLPISKNVACHPCKIGSLKAEWLIPKTSSYSPIILYLHGGGYCLGSLNTHRAFLSFLSKITHARVLNIDYPLAPSHPFPAALKHALKAYTWLQKHEEDQSLYVAGDSAGGGLALSLLLALKKKHLPLPKGIICFSPWADLAASREELSAMPSREVIINADSLPSIARLYAGQESLQHPLISPVYDHLNDLPPILIQVASEELLLRDSLRLFKKVKKRNGLIILEIWDSMIHAWTYAAPFLPEAIESLEHVKKFIEGVEKGKKTG